jgi:TPR repeat protein
MRRAAWLTIVLLGCKSASAPANGQCATAGGCEKICAVEDAAGCFALGVKLANGNGVPKSSAEALEAFDRACELGSGIACLNAGVDVQEGVGAQADASKAAALFQRGCDLKEGRACTYLANQYAQGRGVGKDWDKVISLSTRACDLGSPAACSNLGALALAGDHMPKDPARANAFFAKGCALPGGSGFMACLELAESYRSGRGVPPDLDRALAYEQEANLRLSEGCTAGLPHACLQLAKHVEQGVGAKPDPGKAAELHRHACELARSQECPSPGTACKVSIAECSR